MSVQKLLAAAILMLLVCVNWNVEAMGGGANILEYLRYGLFGLLSGLTILLSHLLAGIRREASVLAFPAGAALLLAFLLYVQISAVWGDGMPTSLIKAALIAIAMVSSIAASSVVATRDIVRLVMAACGIYVVAGFVVAMAIPSIGVETGWLLEGKWRGLSGQKNGFGALATLMLTGTIILAFGRNGSSGQRAYLWPTLLIAFFGFCLVMAGSRGAQLMAVIGLAAALFIKLPERLQVVLMALAAIVLLPLVPFGILSFSSDQTTLSIFGLSFDTSSRTEIWAYGLRLLSGRELLGFGLSGFWTPARMDVFKADNGWVLDNFHNGFMTILIEGGLVGIGLLLAVIGTAFFALRRRAILGGRDETFMFSLFCMIVAHNLIENDFGRSTDIFFLLFLLSVFSLVFRTAPRGSPLEAAAPAGQPQR